MLMAACGALLLVSCSTTQTRIADHPEIYQRLSAEDQALVSRGEIRTGMRENAVWLAWGAPDQRGGGRNRGRPVETWIYLGTTNSDSGFGYGFGGGGGFGYGGGFGGGSGFGYGGGFGGGSGFGYGGGFRYLHQHASGRLHQHFYYDPFYDPFFYNRISLVRYPERTVSFENGRVIAYNFLPPPRFY